MMPKTTRVSRWTVSTVALSLVASRAFAAVDHGKTFGAGGVAERFLAVDNAINYLDEGNPERRLQGELSRIDVRNQRISGVFSGACVRILFFTLKLSTVAKTPL